MKSFYRHNIAFILYFFACIFLFAQCTESPESKLRKMAKETTEKCPISIDAYTSLDSCKVNSNNVYQCYHTISKINLSPLFDYIEFEKQMKPIIIGTIKINPGIDFYKDNNVNFEYIYNDESGKQICTIKILPEDYK